jgi:pectate lyase
MSIFHYSIDYLKSSYLVLFICVCLFIAPSPALSLETSTNGLIGFASVNADGVNGTTGGQGGEIVRPGSYGEFSKAASGSTKRIIEINKKFSGSDIQVGSNKTIIGVSDAALITGFGLQISGQSNIIIKNIRFDEGGTDAINITGKAHHVWIDHCSFRKYKDGLVDIKHGASYITVSWSHFQNHHKSCLLGHSNGSKNEDVGKLKVTYHHNWFDGTGSRHPRVRFGEAHVFNNYYVGNGYGIASTCDAKVLVEANYFKDVGNPTLVGYASSWDGELVERDNIYKSSGKPETKGNAFEASTYYTYKLDAANNIPDIVMKGAGAGKTAPITSLSYPKLYSEAPSLTPKKRGPIVMFQKPASRLVVLFRDQYYRLDGKSLPKQVK